MPLIGSRSRFGFRKGEALDLHLVRFMNSLLAALIIMSVSSFAVAEDSKVEIEPRAQVIIWDEGKLRGMADSGDDVTDFTRPCVAEIEPSLEDLRHRKLSSAARIGSLTAGLLGSLGIQDQLAMNPVSALQGDPQAPVFFLFPETHIQESPSASTVLLHESRAMDMARLTKDLIKNDVTVLNFDEGPLGLPWVKSLQESPKDPAEALEWAKRMLSEYSMSGAVLIGEAFSPGVKTAYNDDNDLWIRWVLTVFALDRQDWNQARDVLMKSSRVIEAKIAVDNYKSFYGKLLRSSKVKLKNDYSRYCESRSQKMAAAAYEAAKAGHARVVFMSFGSLHAYGIMEQLKKYSASFIVFSPNYR